MTTDTTVTTTTTIEKLLDMATRHAEKCFWVNAGPSVDDGWRLVRRGDDPARRCLGLRGDAATAWSRKHGEVYKHLVAILGRRAQPHRSLVERWTPTAPDRLRLARDILAGRHVSPQRLASIEDARARHWAIMMTGGLPDRQIRRINRLASHLPPEGRVHTINIGRKADAVLRLHDGALVEIDDPRIVALPDGSLALRDEAVAGWVGRPALGTEAPPQSE